MDLESVWQWPKIKQESSFLIYRLSKSIKEKIESFYEILEKFVHLHNQRIYLLENVIIEEIKNKFLEEVKKKTGRDSFSSGPKGTYYQLTIGGKLYRIVFHELIFKDQTLDKYIEELKNDPTIPNRDIRDEKFIVDGVNINNLDKGNLNKIVDTILKKIKEDSKLEEFVEKCREIKIEAQTLRQELYQFSYDC